MTGNREIVGGLRVPLPHDSAHKHVTGEAIYTDDIRAHQSLLYAAIGTSTRAHARIKQLDMSLVEAAPGVVAVITARDIPGTNDIGPVVAGEPVFATDVVECVGQSLFAVAARDVESARRAATQAIIDYEELQPTLTIEEALAQQHFILPPYTMKRGDSAAALTDAPHRLSGQLATGGQDHLYLEGQVALAVPQEDGDMLVFSSTQHPSEVQHLVARVLGRPDSAVTTEVRRLGGAFGGKETQAALVACIAALLANKTGCPVNLRLDRDDDMIMTGKRHDFLIDYDVGFDENGTILGIDIQLASRCGMSADLSGPVNDRAMFHADNCYYLDNVTLTSLRCKTNTVSNTAMRGFGAPQAMMGIEYVVDEIARYLDKDPLDVRKANFYGIGDRDITPYHMRVEDNELGDLVSQLEHGSDYRTRRRAIRSFNDSSPVLKKGIALTPVKFGISFTTAPLNQAGALIHVYTDGSVHLNHGGTEMGQGLFTNVAQIVAEELQIDVQNIKITATNTGKVPNTSATAASSGTDLNGKAAQAAAQTIKHRLAAFAAERFDVEPAQVTFRANEVLAGSQRLSFGELVRLAHRSRVSLSATGHYRTPKIHFDREQARGRPFFYFAYGAAVSEVLIDILTGEYRVLRVDILQDAGEPINPAIALGQVEGGFVQGMGWLTTEELCWDAAGRLQTHGPSTYKIPTCSDLPPDFRVRLYDSGQQREDVVGHSKAVGEPPFMLAISVFHAIKDAIASVCDYTLSPKLDAPATPERVLLAIERLRVRPGEC
ncbi:MAG: aldehyde oxidase [Gemmatimonas sp. SG8_17]|nr:MAG: aldehyde oxidase [Gemmatimonas sp. SG8_17]